MIWYAYPMWHRVSFTLIAERHVRELRRRFRVYAIDERALDHVSPATRPLVVVHPYFYNAARLGERVERLLCRTRGLVGVDVADSDRLSNLAVSMTHYAEAVVVPSEWARDAYVRSGVRVPVHVVPHGVDDSYFTEPPRVQSFGDLARLKRERGLVYLLHFCWHSPYRKGLDLVLKAYEAVRRERRDVVLVAKFMPGDSLEEHVIRRLGGVVVKGWLSEEQKRELYDLCDVYLLFSRGGAFELNGLEALVRGEVVLAADGGPWTEYLPRFSLVRSRPCPWVLKDNPIHVGGGVEVDVERAVDRILEVVDDLDEYRARVREHVDARVRGVYTWGRAGDALAGVIERYL